jgi:4-amino-4-deoxy-L-arabinose transferase-like glycosyltransferase
MTDAALPGPRAEGSILGWAIRSPLAYALILLLGLALFLPGFTTLPAVDRDEARFAQSSRQMLESRDFLHIRLQDEARLKKPVGIYWLQAAGTALAGGEDPANPVWTYRLPSLIGALGAMLATLWIGRRWFGAEAGFVAAALLGSCLLLGYEARQAKTDAFLLLTILIAIGELAAAWIPGATGSALPRHRWVAFWVAIGIGILIKGPIILFVVGLAALTLAILDRGVGWINRLRPWPGIAVAAAIALPWLIAITIATKGAFLSESVGADMASKLAGVQESHGAPPGSYLALFPITFWPGSLLALLGIPWIWRNRRDRAVLFCLAWLIPAWIVLEFVPTKLPHYVLPLYPALALLAGAALADRLARPVPGAPLNRWAWAPLILWALIGLALGVGMIAAAPLGDHRPSIRGILAGLAIFGLTAGVAWLMRRGERLRAAAAMCVGAALVWGLVFGAALPALEAPWIAPRLKEALFEALPTGHGPIFIAGYAEPSAAVAFGTATKFGSGSDAADFLTIHPDGIAIVEADQKGAFYTRLGDAAAALQKIATIDGYNYAKGKRVSLAIYRKAGS